MKEFSRNEIAMFKKVAGLVYPYAKKNAKLQAQIDKAQAEIDTNNAIIEGIEKLVIEKTGYHTLDIVELVEKPTNRLDAKGNVVYDKSWQLKYENVIPENVEDTFEDIVPETEEEPAAETESSEILIDPVNTTVENTDEQSDAVIY